MSGYIINSEQLAGIFQVTMRTIQNWRRSKGLPATYRDRYDLVEVIQWYERRIRADDLLDFIASRPTTADGSRRHAGCGAR